MNGTAEIIGGHLLVAPAYQEGLYTPEKHLFYLAIEMFIYEYRRSIGMLNAHVEPFYHFYPITVENSRDGDTEEKINGLENKKE